MEDYPELKATGVRNLPCHSFDANAAWLEIVLTAADLVTWTQLIGFTDHPHLARVEISTFRYRVLHVAARLTRGALARSGWRKQLCVPRIYRIRGPPGP